ncbi:MULTISPECIES: hypothetical protein [Streptomyces]|nr:hypothetical protein [Streptomyces hilarionis]MCQ9129552.1 hypothetical protein [Streptomyces hilarionis]
MSIEEITVTAAGGRAPDFVPLWAEVLIILAAFGVMAWRMRRRDRR